MESLVPILILFGLPALLAATTMLLLASYRREGRGPGPAGKAVTVAGFSVLIGFLGWVALGVAGDAFATDPFGDVASWMYLGYFLIVGALLGFVMSRKIS